MEKTKTAIVTGASGGIGKAIVQAFRDRGYNIVASSLTSLHDEFTPAPNLALVKGDIGNEATAEKIAATAISTFGSIDHVVNNAGIFKAKPFTEYTASEFHKFRVDEPCGIPSYHAACRQTDAFAGHGR